MTFDGRRGSVRTAHFPLVASALERHMGWAVEHAAVGEYDVAASVLRDVCAVAAEITESDGGLDRS